MSSRKRLARVAGLLYLVVGVSGGFSQLYVRPSLVVPDDAAATARNLAGSAGLFRVGFVTDLVHVGCFLLLAFVLYELLRPVDQRLAAAFVVLNAVAMAIMGVNLLNHFAALLVASEPGYASGFPAGSSEELVLLFTDLHAQGYLISGVFFGLWLLPLGYLVYRSGYFPRTLGVVLMVGCFGYLANTFVTSLFPAAGAAIGPILAWPAGVAEIAFMLWLLVKGVNESEPEPEPEREPAGPVRISSGRGSA
jgi:hypothetical protein